MVAVSICAMSIMAFLPVFWALPTTFHRRGLLLPAGSPRSTRSATRRASRRPYITGWLADLTGSQKTGLWVVGAVRRSPARPSPSRWQGAPDADQPQSQTTEH